MAYTGKVIDCRLRPPTEKFKAQHSYISKVQAARWGAGRAGGNLQEWLDQSMDDFVKEMEKLNMIGVVATRLYPGGPEVTNDHLKYDIVEKYPGRFIPIGAVDHTNWRSARDEMDRIAKWGFKGISLEFGRRGDMPFDDRRLYPLYAHCESLNLVCQIVTSPVYIATPSSFDAIAADFPNLRIFLAHGGYPYFDETFALVWRRPNVWFSPDCYSFSPGADRWIEACNYSTGKPKYPVYPLHFQMIQDRYCYGSAIPYSTPLKVRLEEWKRLGWKEEILEKLLYKNAAELFRLESSK